MSRDPNGKAITVVVYSLLVLMLVLLGGWIFTLAHFIAKFW